eukprot:SM000002S05795  [mRNA]  locus=s2:2101288:2111551:+ [translate_table: standard]
MLPRYLPKPATRQIPTQRGGHIPTRDVKGLPYKQAIPLSQSQVLRVLLFAFLANTAGGDDWARSVRTITVAATQQQQQWARWVAGWLAGQVARLGAGPARPEIPLARIHPFKGGSLARRKASHGATRSHPWMGVGRHEEPWAEACQEFEPVKLRSPAAARRRSRCRTLLRGLLRRPAPWRWSRRRIAAPQGLSSDAPMR